MANVEKQIVEGAAAVSVASFLRMKENVENILNKLCLKNGS